jgi:hypothetical protein
VDIVGQALLASATAYVGATLLKWTWIAWYLSDHPSPPLERGLVDQLNVSAAWMFNGTFVLVTLLAIWWMRRGKRPGSQTAGPAQTTGKPAAVHHGLWRLAALFGHVLLAVFIAGACAEWAGRVYARWYAYDIGVPLHELSDDYYMAFGAVLLRLKMFLALWLLLMWRLRPKRGAQ